MSKKQKNAIHFTVDGLDRYIKKIGTRIDASVVSSVWKQESVFSDLQQAPPDVIQSREMEIALHTFLFPKEQINSAVEDYFFEHYPHTLQNAIKLVFRFFIEVENHPRWSRLAERMRETPVWHDFLRITEAIAHKHRELKSIIERNWRNVRNKSFEHAIVASGFLYLENVLGDKDAIYNSKSGSNLVSQSWINAISEYLTRALKTKVECNWSCRDKDEIFRMLVFPNLLQKLYNLFQPNSANDVKDYIFSIIELKKFEHTFMDSFCFDAKAIFKVESESVTCEYKSSADRDLDIKLHVSNHFFAYEVTEMLKEIPQDVVYGNPNGANHKLMKATLFESKVASYFLNQYHGVDCSTEDVHPLNCLKTMFSEYYLSSWTETCERVSELSFHERYKQYFDSAFINTIERFPFRLYTDAELQQCTGYPTSTFEFIRTPLSNQAKVDLVVHPLLKHDNVFITFPFIHANWNIELGILNHTKRKLGQERARIKKESSAIEQNVKYRIEQSPIFAGATVKNALPYEVIIENKKIEGEIDVAILKDNTLFLIEVKSTYGILNIKESFRHEQALIHAGHQLTRALKSILSDSSIIAQWFPDTAISADKLEIRTLIVSTSSECDHQRFNGHLKISFTELLCALYNDCQNLQHDLGLLALLSKKKNPALHYRLMELINRTPNAKSEYTEGSIFYEYCQSISDEYFSDETLGKEYFEYCNLYPNGPSLSRFIDIIENNEVWGRILPSWRYANTNPRPQQVKYDINDF